MLHSIPIQFLHIMQQVLPDNSSVLEKHSNIYKDLRSPRSRPPAAGDSAWNELWRSPDPEAYELDSDSGYCMCS